jgi:hypothetical protein
VNFGFALKLQTLLVHDQPQLALPQSDAFVHVLPPPDALDEASALLASTEDAASVDVAPAPP